MPIPALTEDRRQELVKVAHKYAEDARVAVRNVRRHAMDDLKHAEQNNEFSQDEYRRYTNEVQDLTDEHIAGIDEALANKEQEILQG